MPERLDFPAKLQGATRLYSTDFSSELAEGETLSSCLCTASTYSGTDAAPSNILSGLPAISGDEVQQLIQAGTEGVVYELLFQAVTSLSQILQRSGYLAIAPNLVG